MGNRLHERPLKTKRVFATAVPTLILLGKTRGKESFLFPLIIIDNIHIFLWLPSLSKAMRLCFKAGFLVISIKRI